MQLRMSLCTISLENSRSEPPGRTQDRSMSCQTTVILWTAMDSRHTLIQVKRKTPLMAIKSRPSIIRRQSNFRRMRESPSRACTRRQMLRRNGSTGANCVFIFDHSIRPQPKDTCSDPEKIQLRGPVRRVHIDQSCAASEQRVYHHLPEIADELVKKRFQIVNVTRAFRYAIHRPQADSYLGVVANQDDLQRSACCCRCSLCP